MNFNEITPQVDVKSENNNFILFFFIVFVFKNSGFGPDPNGHYEMRFTGPQFILEGPYTMKGQILILPVQGQGKCNFTLDNPELFVRFTGKSKVKNGKTHLYTDDLRMTFKITRFVHLIIFSHFFFYWVQFFDLFFFFSPLSVCIKQK